MIDILIHAMNFFFIGLIVFGVSLLPSLSEAGSPAPRPRPKKPANYEEERHTSPVYSYLPGNIWHTSDCHERAREDGMFPHFD